VTDKEKPPKPTIEELESMGRAPWKTAGKTTDNFTFSDLYCELNDFFRHHLDLRDERYYHVLTAWTNHTWRINDWRASGPLCLIGPISSGKTTVLECLEEVVYRGIRGGSMSNPTMFRLSDEYTPTLLIDESQVYNREEWAEAQAFINERYRKGGKVWRCDEQNIPRFYRAYGATALAQSDMPWDALVSRALILKMEKGKPKAQTLTPEFESQGYDLRRKLATFADRWVNSGYDADWLPVQELDLHDLNDYRVREVGTPLLEMSPTTGPRQQILSYLKDLETSHNAEESTDYLSDYVVALTRCPAEGGKWAIASVRKEIAILYGEWDLAKDTVKNSKNVPKSRTVGSALRTLGFEPTRMTGGLRGVRVDPDRLQRLLVKYSIPGEPPPIVTTVTTVTTSTKKSDDSDASDAKPRDPMNEVIACDRCKVPLTRREYQKHDCPRGDYD